MATRSPLHWLLLCLAALGAAWGQGDDRPNILMVFADDWGKYASIYAEAEGKWTLNDFVQTPNFDALARGGALFKNAHVTSPSCTPCRSSLLSGQYFFRTGRGAILQGAAWDDSIPTYPLLLEKAGYHIGFTAKVWSPGTPADQPYGGKRNAYAVAPQQFNNFSQATMEAMRKGEDAASARSRIAAQAGAVFEKFLQARAPGKPFCYWFGPTNTHRKWVAGSGKKIWGLDPDRLAGRLPPFLPDVPVVREDLNDYFGEVMAFDAMLGELISKLKASGELENTLVVVSGDHGAPGFPRGKCNLYDFGTHVSLAVSWPKTVAAGRVIADFVNLMDLAPTFLEAGGVAIPEVMTGKSLMPVLKAKESGQIDPERTWVITGRERHVAEARDGGLPYPQRALRTKDYLYINNIMPERWPMGNPWHEERGVPADFNRLANDTFVSYPDLDASPTKAFMIEHQKDPSVQKSFELGFAKRPEEELYILGDDPHEIHNVAYDARYAELKARLLDQLMTELWRVNDPRITQEKVPFEHPPFVPEPKP